MSHTFFTPASLNPSYQALVSRLKQTQRAGFPLRAPVLAVVSATSGAGVSSVTESLVEHMNAGPKAMRSTDVTVSVTSDEMESSTLSLPDFVAHISGLHEAAMERVFTLALERTSHAESALFEKSHASEEYLSVLKTHFRLVLVECPPLRESSSIAALAPLVDGVIVVIEANKTTRAQAQRLAQTIETAGGRVFGYILNKQKYAVPSSIYQMCEKAGLI